MNKIIIAALVLVAGGCSLVKVATRPAPATTINQATQMVLTDAGAFNHVGVQWLRLHPCVIEETAQGLAVEQSGTNQPAVPIQAAGYPAGTREVGFLETPGRTGPAMVANPQCPPAATGGSPILMDVTAIQDAQDTTDSYRRANAGLQGQIVILKSSEGEQTRWIIGLIAISVLEFVGMVLLLIRIAKRSL